MLRAVSLSNSGTNDVALTDATALVLGTVGVGQNLAVISEEALTQSGALTVVGASSFNAGANGVTLSNESNALGGAVTLMTRGAGGDVVLVNGGALSLESAVTGTLATTATTGGITDSGALSVTGTATIEAAGFDITLDSSDNSLSAVALTGNDVSVVSTGSLTGIVTGTSLQAKGGTGVDLNTVVSTLAATTESGDLSITNVGGLTIDKFESGLGLDGLSVTSSDADSDILLRALSTITNSAGAVTLAAEGNTATDAITVNAAISTVGEEAVVNLYAGGSIELTKEASISSAAEANLFFGTDYNNAVLQVGYTEASIEIAKEATLTGDVQMTTLGLPNQGIKDGRVTSTTLDSVSDYFNALEPLLEGFGNWNVIGTGALLESTGLGTIVLDVGVDATVSVEEEENEK